MRRTGRRKVVAAGWRVNRSRRRLRSGTARPATLRFRPWFRSSRSREWSRCTRSAPCSPRCPAYRAWCRPRSRWDGGGGARCVDELGRARRRGRARRMRGDVDEDRAPVAAERLTSRHGTMRSSLRSAGAPQGMRDTVSACFAAGHLRNLTPRLDQPLTALANDATPAKGRTPDRGADRARHSGVAGGVAGGRRGGDGGDARGRSRGRRRSAADRAGEDPAARAARRPRGRRARVPRRRAARRAARGDDRRRRPRSSSPR